MNIPDYAAAWQLDKVDTLSDADKFLGWIDTVESVAIDTETWGLEPHGRGFVRLVTFANDVSGWAIAPEQWGTVTEQALARIRERSIRVYMWHARFDMTALDYDGFTLPHWDNIVDGMLLHHCTDSGARHGLKPVADRELGRWATVGEQVLKNKYGKKWYEVDVDTPEYWQYGVVDALLTHHISERLNNEALDVEMQVADICWRIERRGMRIDTNYAQSIAGGWAAEAVELERKLKDQGIDNPLSNGQVEQAFRSMGWKPEEFTATGQAVLDKVVLASLDFPAAAQLMEYKQLRKWLAAYIVPFAESGGRVHPEIHTLRATTGRMSITNPALQTLPSGGSGGSIRRAVLPEPGHVLYAVDYDGQEARILANLSGDPGMTAAYDRGEDLYTHVAQMVWQDDTITKADPRRKLAKVIMLAFTYGAGVEKLALTSGRSHNEVSSFLRRVFEEFPGIRALTGDHALGGNYPGEPALEAAERYDREGLAYVVSRNGRIISMPPDETYKALNRTCQGTGADVLKSAMVRLDRHGLADYIVAPVHDELVFSFPKDEAVGMAAEAHRLMEDYQWDYVPLTCEVSGPFENWGEAYT